MKKLKRQLLFTLSQGSSFSGSISTFEYFCYQQIYWRMQNFQKVSIRSGMSQLVKAGLVNRIIRKQIAWFRLTKIGKQQLASFFSVISYGDQTWDLTWRLLILGRKKLTIVQLKKLRLTLKQFGFASLERGVYISPFSSSRKIIQWLAKNKLLGCVKLLETKKFLLGDDQSFASSIWQLDTIYNKYQRLSTLTRRLLYRVMREKRLTNQAKKQYRFVFSSWQKLLLQDPGLPKKLLPADWPRQEIQKLFSKVNKYVLEMEKVGQV